MSETEELAEKLLGFKLKIGVHITSELCFAIDHSKHLGIARRIAEGKI